MSLRIGIVGTGAFAQSFIPLFKAHPLVGQVVLCDLDGEKLQRNAAKHQIADTSPSLDALHAPRPRRLRVGARGRCPPPNTRLRRSSTAAFTAQRLRRVER